MQMSLDSKTGCYEMTGVNICITYILCRVEGVGKISVRRNLRIPPLPHTMLQIKISFYFFFI